MGSRSRSSSSNTSGATSSTMGKLAGGRTSNSTMMGLLEQLQGSQLGGMLPIIGALIKDGKGTMASNPMAPFFGQPIQVQTPDFLSGFIEKHNPQEPQQQPPGQPNMHGNMPTSQFNQVAHSANPDNMGWTAMPDDYVPRHGALRDIKNIMSKPDHAFNPERRNRSGGGFMGY